MSTLIFLAATDLHAHVEAVGRVAALPAAGNDDILGWINAKAGDTQNTALNVGKAILLILLVLRMWTTRGALAAGITAGITIAILWFVLGNLPGLSDRVNKEVNGLGLVTRSAQVPGLPSATDPLRHAALAAAEA